MAANAVGPVVLGDPDEILDAGWSPGIPGIDAPGSYDDYAKDPSRFIFTS